LDETRRVADRDSAEAGLPVKARSGKNKPYQNKNTSGRAVNKEKRYNAGREHTQEHTLEEGITAKWGGR